MKTIAQIDTDIARIEALMKLGSAREVSKLSNLRELCFSAKKLVGKVTEDFLMKQLDTNQKKYEKYLEAKVEVDKVKYAEYKKLAQKKLDDEYKPVILSNQIKFMLYFLGEVELVTQDLLHSLNMCETGKHAAGKVNPV